MQLLIQAYSIIDCLISKVIKSMDAVHEASRPIHIQCHNRDMIVHGIDFTSRSRQDKPISCLTHTYHFSELSCVYVFR